MDIQEDGKPVGVRPIQQLVDILQRTIPTTTLVRSIRLVLVITHWKSKGVDARGRQLLDNVLCHPRLPLRTFFERSNDTQKQEQSERDSSIHSLSLFPFFTYMLTQLSIGLLGAQHFTKRVGIHGNLTLSLS